MTTDLIAVAWTSYNCSNSTTHPVGQKQANGYGLYDMTGNVSEWMQDRYDNEHDWRAVRGGAWESNTRYLRATHRNGIAFESRGGGFTVGFRVARTLP